MTMYFRFVICGFNFVNSTIVDNNLIDLVGGVVKIMYNKLANKILPLSICLKDFKFVKTPLFKSILHGIVIDD